MGFCQPTLMPHTSVPDQGQNRNCKNGSGDTPVEDVIMIPSSTGTVGGLSKNSPTSTRQCTYANALMQQEVPTLVIWPTYLRESYTSQRFSEKASDLMLASWRPQTNSKYRSGFAQWASWCKQRGQNPLNGPVSDVVNFLAELFSKGYQYQSLNSYHSAISSAHERIDGISVGQHSLELKELTSPDHHYLTTLLFGMLEW